MAKMDNTFYSMRYKQVYIHAHTDMETGKEVFTIQGYPTVILPSLLSAKQRITKLGRKI